jgi:hypothetical protein
MPAAVRKKTVIRRDEKGFHRAFPLPAGARATCARRRDQDSEASLARRTTFVAPS